MTQPTTCDLRSLLIQRRITWIPSKRHNSSKSAVSKTKPVPVWLACLCCVWTRQRILFTWLILHRKYRERQKKKRMKLRITHVAGLLAIALVATALQSPANADELVRWNLSDPLDGFSGFGINTQDASIASATITKGSGMGQFAVGPDSVFSNILKAGPGTTVGGASAATALANNWYFDVTLTPTSTIDISSIQLDWSRGGTGGDRGWFVRSSVDSYASDLYSVFTGNGTAVGLNSVDINLTGFTGLASSTTFRFYTYTDRTGRYNDFQNLRFNGNDSGAAGPGSGGAVPEPSEWAAMGLLGAGLAGLVIRKRRSA